MSNIAILESLKQEMQKSAFDIKAEAILLLAMEKGLSLEEIIIGGDKLFNREYSRDVVSSELKEDRQKQNYLRVHLSRSGFYDQLPEGLFFQLAERGNRNSRVADMSIVPTNARGNTAAVAFLVGNVIANKIHKEKK